MNKGCRWFLFLLFQAFAVVLLTGSGWISVRAWQETGGSEDTRYFPQTGHWVTNDFLKAYLSVPNPEQIFGNPITEAYHEQTYGRLVQYFERALFEMHPDAPAELQVQIAHLGDLLYERGKPLPLPENFPACEVVPETGFQVCYAFLEFYKENGGAALFGYPISNFEINDGRIVQHFQRARFEWHPERTAGQRVLLTDLGRMYFDRIGENPFHLLAVRDNRIPQSVINLKARAYPETAVLPADGRQAVTILVQDQSLRPVANAQVTLEVDYPSGQIQRFVIPSLTDRNGLARHEFKFTNQPIGLVKINVKVVYENQRTKTVTSFRIWY